MAHTEFVPGQRWISNTEAELGLGIVVECANRRVEISFPAAGDSRTYATDNAPLSRVCYEPDEQIRNDDGVLITIRERIEHNGCFIYLGVDESSTEMIVPEIHLDSAVHFSKPQERLFAGQIDRHSLFKLRVDTLEHQYRLQKSSAYGLMGARVQLLPHQMYIASELSSRPAPRALLADEVGLGKTIEAGLILHQHWISGRAKRVLVLLPDSLLHQWLVEMLRRFNLVFTLLDEERCLAIAESGHENPFDSAQLILAPVSLLSRNPLRLEQASSVHWDILVVDEAHHLGWSREVVSHAYQCVEQVASVSDGLLLLTATPEQLGPEGHFARLRLLDPDRYPDLERFLDEESSYRHLNVLIEALMTEGADLLKQDAHLQAVLAERLGADTLEHWKGLSEIEQSANLHKMIADLVDRQGTGRVLFRNTRKNIDGFPERVLHTYPLIAPTLFSSEGEDEPALEPLLHPEKRLGDTWISSDPRVAWLLEWLKTNKKEKALVICAHAETAVMLEDFLNLRGGVRSTVFHEGMSLVNRDRSAAYFAEQDLGAQVLISSEIGSEGRNFQFCHHLVLFDLPLSPDLLEQRIGRLDRIGQHHSVQIHLPYYQHSATEVLMRWYHEGLEAFTRVCSTGDALYHRFAQPLRDAMRHPGERHALQKLLEETQQERQDLESELSFGRDRLLEMSSFNAAKADSVISQIHELENGKALQDYAEKLFDRFGIAVQPHGERGLVVHPGEQMLYQLSELPEDGMTLTFSRKEALSREDVEFLSWEHPLLLELMELLTRNDLGNNALGVLKLPALPAGTLLVETVFTLNLAVPRSLQLARYLPSGYLRVLTGPEGQDLSAVLAHKPLNQLVQPVPLATSRNMARVARDNIVLQLKHGQAIVDKQLPGLIESALHSLLSDRTNELERLKALAAVNPAIHPQEISQHVDDTEMMRLALERASLRLDALRVIVVSE